MKKLAISLLFISVLILGGSINTTSTAQDVSRKEQKAAKKAEAKQKNVDKKAAKEAAKKPSIKKNTSATVLKDSPKKNGFTKNWFFGVKGGATFFISPLKDHPFSWGAAATLGKQLNSKVGIKADYLYGNLKSDGKLIKKMSDGSYYQNNLFANVDFMEISLLLKLNLNDFFYSSSPKHLREIYMFGGGAYTMYRTKITDENGAFVTGTAYSKTGKQETMANTMAVPLGLGVTYKLGAKDIVNLNAEFGYRFAQSEKLNGGLSDKVANYTFTSLGLLFNLGKSGISPQKVTADLVKEAVEASLDEKIDKNISDKVTAEVNPLKEELAKQSTAVANNQDQLNILQEELEARTNAIKEQLGSNSTGSVSMTDGKGGVGGINISSVYFAFNSTYITPAMQREIATIAKVLKKNKQLTCEIVGNSSNVGSPEYNKQLSQKRAETVMNLLTDEFKISADRFTLINKGLDDPLAENLKKINRRVDLIIK